MPALIKQALPKILVCLKTKIRMRNRMRKKQSGNNRSRSHSRSVFVGFTDEISNHFLEDIGVIADLGAYLEKH